MKLIVNVNEINQLVFQLVKDQKINFYLSNKLVFESIIKGLKIKANLNLSADKCLKFEVDRVLLAGINITALGRSQVYSLVKKYNSDKIEFVLEGRFIKLFIKGVNFTSMEINNNEIAIGLRKF